MTDGRIGRWLMICAGIVVVATLVVAMTRLGSPATQRDLRLDERRTTDLKRIVVAVDAYAVKHDGLPATLDILARQPGWLLTVTDPVDRRPYNYQVTGDRTFKLCATFATDTAKALEESGAWTDDDWLHGTGRQCFDRTADEKND